MWRAGETQWMTAKREGSVDDSCKRGISGWQLQERDKWMTAARGGSVDDSFRRAISGWLWMKTNGERFTNDSCMHEMDQWMKNTFQWITSAWYISVDCSCINISVDDCYKKRYEGMTAAWKILGDDSRLHKRYQGMTAAWQISVDDSWMKDISGWQLHERYQWMTAKWKISVDDSCMKDISG